MWGSHKNEINSSTQMVNMVLKGCDTLQSGRKVSMIQTDLLLPTFRFPFPEDGDSIFLQNAGS